ncbi:MAG: hypothetical protein MK078_08585 [Crocinitomicaceae bacterium]|nr:hypothetical protein [Crocinitomicaceae bacterium]
MPRIRAKKSLILLISTCLTILTSSCTEETTVQEVQEIVAEEVCKPKKVDDFDQFIGMDYGYKEIELEQRFGELYFGEYSEDSLSFLYYFEGESRTPITVACDAKQGLVTNILIEVLTLDENFDKDVDVISVKYDFSECDMQYFGMTEKEIKQELGEPLYNEELEGGVKSITYQTEIKKVAVNFKFYPEQDYVCSSVMILWFY